MKFRCERDVLADAVATAGRAATNRTGTLPVLAGVRLEVSGDTLTVTGTDLELTIRLVVEVGGERDGAAVVPARLVGDIVKALPAGAVGVELGDDEMSISAGRSQFSVRPLSLDDYPAQAEPAADGVTLPASTMADALRQVVRAASTDDARAVLTGVLLAAEDDETGFDAGTGKFVNMFKAGIVDPTKVTVTALRNAVSVSGLLLTTETLVTELKDDEEVVTGAIG